MRHFFAPLVDVAQRFGRRFVVSRPCAATRAEAAPRPRRRISRRVTIPYTLFVAVLTPIYWVQYGPSNFLWFSDMALFGTLLALWLESRLITSMMALAVLLPELAWNVDYFSQLLFGRELVGFTSYMFDETIPAYLRGLSLFHVALPPLLLWSLFRLGYAPHALPAQTLLAWIVLPLSYPFAHAPEHNINWTRGLQEEQVWMPDWMWVGLLMLGIPLLIYWPTHLLLRSLFAR